MAWTKNQLGLAFLMLITGSINTISTKWADTSEAVGIDGEVARAFDHPFLQAVGMFLGEFSCLIVFQVLRVMHSSQGRPLNIGDQEFSPLIFWPAALFDMTATSLMYVGLNMTFASSFQMLRGSVIVFTGILSVTFLRRVIKHYQWAAMFIVIAGLVLVGLSDIVFGSSEGSRNANTIITGDLLIIIAQVISASQVVYEEKFLTKHNIPPLQAVGWEGLFGASTLGVLLIPMYFIKVGHPISNDPNGRLENTLDAFVQMGNNYIIIIATVGNIVSIAFFNFSGISVTKELSGTTRMVLDSGRTVIIWVVSLLIGWQPFVWKQFGVQALGFVLLIVGMCIYNDIVFHPLCNRLRRPSTMDGGLGGANRDQEPLITEYTPAIQDTADSSTVKRSGYGTQQPKFIVDV